MRCADIIAADSIGNRAPHVFAKGKAVFLRPFIAKFDIDFRLGQICRFDPLLNIGNAVGICSGNLFRARFRARQLPENADALRMVLDGLVIEIDHDHRYARFFKTRQFRRQRLVLNLRNHQHIGFQRQRLFRGESIADDVADIVNVF